MSVNGVAAGNATDGASGAQHMRGHHQLSDKAVSALADKLGMSADDLKTKLAGSDDPRKVLDQLAEEKGISKQELRETIRSAMPKPPEGQGGPLRAARAAPGRSRSTTRPVRSCWRPWPIRWGRRPTT